MKKRVLLTSAVFALSALLYGAYVASRGVSGCIVVATADRADFSAWQDYPGIPVEVGLMCLAIIGPLGNEYLSLLGTPPMSRLHFLFNVNDAMATTQNEDRLARIDRVAEMFVRFGDNVDAEDDLGCTPLEVARYSGKSHFVNLLTRLGAEARSNSRCKLPKKKDQSDAVGIQYDLGFDG